jgi:hypothetical protein
MRLLEERATGGLVLLRYGLVTNGG